MDEKKGIMYCAEGCKQWLRVTGGRCTSKWRSAVGKAISPNTSVELRKAMDLVIKRYYELVELHDRREKEKREQLDGSEVSNESDTVS